MGSTDRERTLFSGYLCKEVSNGPPKVLSKAVQDLVMQFALKEHPLSCPFCSCRTYLQRTLPEVTSVPYHLQTTWSVKVLKCSDLLTGLRSRWKPDILSSIHVCTKQNLNTLIQFFIQVGETVSPRHLHPFTAYARDWYGCWHMGEEYDYQYNLVHYIICTMWSSNQHWHIELMVVAVS